MTMFFRWIFRLFSNSKLEECQKQKRALENQFGETPVKRILCAIDDIDVPDATSYWQIEEALIHHFLPDIKVKRVPDEDYINWFNNKIYPTLILQNKGKFSWSDGRWWSCTMEDMVDVMKADFVSKLEYQKDRHDCENFARHFIERVAWRYGINTLSEVHGWDKEQDISHSFIVFYALDGDYIIEQTGTDNYWKLEDENKPAVYNISSWCRFTGYNVSAVVE